ncbi:NAD(P)H-dependent oxidoreductase [Eikenella sp. NML120348]|uniref:NAD(P)H-dependent oxidoreductase n=1 Tax=Eikenella sp. NML120348 TaxID=1795831 RepID=UPI0007DF59C7|nr:NAD(P)H-dependent oxidoreductase [Eikenella sp. NML120348]OAM38407.1 NAD(P)H-dependent oxidoreductase [Eikenella sp. NML120348]
MPHTKQTVLKAFHRRYACKKYDPAKKISRKDFEFILETGRLSPSSFGLEPWRFLVIQNLALRAELKPLAWGAADKIMDCSHFVVILARTQAAMQSDYRHKMWSGVHHIPPHIVEIREGFFKQFAEHNFCITESPHAFHDWASKQSYIALANMMTAAAFIGIDSTPIEGFRQEEVNAFLAAKGLFNPTEYHVSIMAAFGYRNEEPRAKTRLPMEEIVQWVE